MSSVLKKLLKGSVLRSITLVANIIVGFFMLPFMIHSLGEDQYGIWIFVGAIIGFYGLLDVGFGSAIIRFIVRAMHGEDSEKDVNIALSSSMYLFSGVGLLSMIITFIIILLIPYFLDSDVDSSLVQLLVAILGLKVSMLFPITSFGGVLMAKYRFDIMSYISLFSLLSRTALTVFFVSNGHGIVTVAYITVIDAIVVSIATIYFAKKLFPSLRVSWSLVSIERLKKYYHYGKYTYITTIADKVRFSIDDIVVAVYVGMGAVTHYTIAVALVRYYGEFMDSIIGVISPVLNEYHKLDQWGKLREVFFVATEISAMMSVLIGGLLIVFGEPLIIIWVGPEFSDVYSVLLILCSALIIAQAQRPSVAVLYAIAKHKYYAKITSIEAVANVCISVILVQYIGIYGVALGTAVPMLANKLIFQPVYTCKQLGVPLMDYYGKVSKYMLVGLVVFYPMFLLKENYVVLDSYLKLILAGFVVTSIYVVINTKVVISDKVRKHMVDVAPDKIKPAIALIC